MGRSGRRSPERTNHGHKRDSKDASHRDRHNKHKRKEESHRERRHRSRSPRERHKPREEEDIKPRIKQEQRDKGYDRQENRHSRWSGNVKIKQEPGMNIKQERDLNIKQEREMNDERRRQNRKNQPENPFQGPPNVPPSTQGEGGNNTTEPGPKEAPNFEQSGALTEDTNTYRGVVIKYNEPPEARKPKRKWRFYIFKGEQQLPTLHIHRQSAYLLGRDRKVADIPVDHPSCSKQHAALQYRLADFTRDDGTTGRRVRPYIIDLDSANGTFLNNQKIEPRRYYELQEKDVVKFGFSSRDYVLLHANSKDDDEDD